ncbi:MAG: DUF3500 domain-containing protein [Gammaproteobacteria bacterium]|nr:DUF3500 domain-containing protein [Gammaproteobacteria bacterium]MCY4358186.1 DUF3500 domain-containing protein [Gammaproteobacteria bacterium]
MHLINQCCFAVRGTALGLITTIMLVGNVLSQPQYPERLLNQKGTFSRAAATALGEPFQGLVTSEGRIEGLFPLQSTGVSTGKVRQAAEHFLATLNTEELSRTHFAIDDPEWRDWSNVDVGIFPRRGISLEEMNSQQKAAAWDLLEASLSKKGLEQTRAIMRTEQTLLELNDEPIRYGEEKYYLTMMGNLSVDNPWGWQLDGHHLVINFFVLGDQVVMTPAFWGGEPVVAQSGLYAGNTIMQPEQDLGLALMQSLNNAQQVQASLGSEKDSNFPMAAANADNRVIDYQGLSATDMSSAQKLALLDLIEIYVGNLTPTHAEVTMATISQHLDSTYFAWQGKAEDDSVFYYRVHSPVIMIEFDHQNPVGTTMINPAGTPTRDHIHAIVRTPNGNDYGKDLLAQHLAAKH